ncbi:hypothetical protein B0H13DRAFT_2313176 [Mycena leptocephala]|nr:hypothetical protein B0H13DRAFT_2313176 [Mycena leptocephala]
MAQKTSPTRSPGYHAHALCGMVEMGILMEGETADIVSNLNAAETVYMALDSPRIVWCSALAAKINLLRGDMETARVAFLEYLSKSRSIFPDIVRDFLVALAEPGHKMYGPMDTFGWAVVYLAFVQKKDDVVEGLQAVRRLADIHILLKDEDTALHLFCAAVEGGTQMDIHRLRAECMVGIGEIMLRRGDLIQAKRMWGVAHLLFDNSYLLLAIREGAVDEATGSALVVLKLSDSDTAAVETSLEKLGNLLAPNTFPSLQLEGGGTEDDIETCF